MSQKVLPFELSGNKGSKTLVVFLHGFPDTVRLWDNIIRDLKSEDAQFLAISYPNYHTSEPSRFGQSMDQLVDRVKITVDYIDQGRNLKKIFVTHDWGAIFGYLFDARYPNYMKEMVSMDVGAHGWQSSELKPYLQQALYQITFAIAFLTTLIPFIGIWLGNFISISFMKVFWGSKFVPKIFTSKMNYLYVELWFNIILSKLTRNKFISTLQNYTPSVPICFIYGKRKPFMFHNLEWQILLSGQKGSEVVETNGGHWVMIHSHQTVVQKIKESVQRVQ